MRNRKGPSMSKEEPYRDQAEKLRKKVEKIDEPFDEYHPLPPRSEKHRAKKKRTKLKVKYPLIRFLTVFFILLPTVIFSIYTYFDSKHNRGSEKAVVTSGYETIQIENQQSGSNNQKIVYHKVLPKETLTMIAMKYYHSKLGIAAIKAENHLQGDNLRTGQVLRIPLTK